MSLNYTKLTPPFGGVRQPGLNHYHGRIRAVGPQA